MPTDWTDYRRDEGPSFDAQERALQAWNFGSEVDRDRIIDVRAYTRLQVSVVDAGGADAWATALALTQSADENGKADEALPTATSVTTTTQTVVADVVGIAYVKISPSTSPSAGETIDLFAYAANEVS